MAYYFGVSALADAANCEIRLACMNGYASYRWQMVADDESEVQ